MFSLFRKAFFSQTKPFTVGPNLAFASDEAVLQYPRRVELHPSHLRVTMVECHSVCLSGREPPPVGPVGILVNKVVVFYIYWWNWTHVWKLSALYSSNAFGESILEVFLHLQIVWNKNHDGFHRCPYSVYVVSPINYPSGATPGRDASETFLVPQTLFLQRHVQH